MHPLFNGITRHNIFEFLQDNDNVDFFYMRVLDLYLPEEDPTITDVLARAEEWQEVAAIKYVDYITNVYMKLGPFALLYVKSAIEQVCADCL